MMALLIAAALSSGAAAPSPRALALGREIAVAGSGQKTLQGMVGALEQVVTTREIMRLPVERRAAPETRKAMKAAVTAEVPGFVGKVVDQAAGIYASEFTEAQLAEAARSRESPGGMAITSRRDELSKAMAAYAATHLPLLVAAIADRYCAQAGCTPEIRAKLLLTPRGR